MPKKAKDGKNKNSGIQEPLVFDKEGKEGKSRGDNYKKRLNELLKEEFGEQQDQILLIQIDNLLQQIEKKSNNNFSKQGFQKITHTQQRRIYSAIVQGIADREYIEEIVQKAQSDEALENKELPVVGVDDVKVRKHSNPTPLIIKKYDEFAEKESDGSLTPRIIIFSPPEKPEEETSAETSSVGKISSDQEIITENINFFHSVLESGKIDENTYSTYLNNNKILESRVKEYNDEIAKLRKRLEEISLLAQIEVPPKKR